MANGLAAGFRVRKNNKMKKYQQRISGAVTAARCLKSFSAVRGFIFNLFYVHIFFIFC